ncbi:SAM-dependent chlorinase/fluorinase [Actinomadura barringtoniae]|uniref:SAM-dependent chlorinase/fluorinase n=1 Tax=Actinomadura barringtoniae TaxID=1427535 RepID=A0A939T6D1_9ACTN|nr:SAM-dependent chlorinase/fluorinase [Actinomadura barringtoniae]
MTFLTDYGLEDGFVAACHGVAARLAPHVRVMDITHLVPPGDVRRGAAVLAQTVPYMPPGVHVAVVDPGVGTARRGIAVAGAGGVFVGPDNGLLSWAARGLTAGGLHPHIVGVPGNGEVRAFELANPKLWLEPVSATFHGRDIFTPVAAQLACGLDIEQVGPEVEAESLVTLPTPMRRVQNGGAEGEVLSVDRFGNVQMSLTLADLDLLGARIGGALMVALGVTPRIQGNAQHAPQRRRTFTVPYRETFGSVAPGELVAYADSAGCLALAVNSGDAAQRLGLPPGARIRISVAE